MRRILTLFLTIINVSLLAQGINFFEGTWEEALAAAKSQEKVIFVDAYAVWCGPCKQMARTTFKDKEVGDFYNKNFINVKLDMEKGDGLTFRKKYPVSAFPTLYFIDYSGETVQKFVGALPAKDFIKAGQTALGSIDRSQAFEEAYNNGDRDPELIYNYVKALNQAGKSSLRITNKYLRAQKDLKTVENLKIIFEGTTEADSWVFGKLIENRKAIEQQFSKREVSMKIFDACKNTADKAVEYKDDNLLKESIKKARTYVPEQSRVFTAAAQMNYAEASKDAAAYVKASKNMSKTFSPIDYEDFHQLANNLLQAFRNDIKARALAEEMAKKAASKGDNVGYYLTYSSILLINDKKDKARDAALRAKEIAEKSDSRAVKNMVDDLLKQIER